MVDREMSFYKRSGTTSSNISVVESFIGKWTFTLKRESRPVDNKHPRLGERQPTTTLKTIYGVVFEPLF